MERKSKNSNGAPEDFFQRDGEMSEQIRQFDWSEEKLRQWEIQMRLVTNAMPVLISYVDAERRYQFVNQTYTDWFGRAPEEIVGKHVREIVGEAAYAEVFHEMERVFAGEAFGFERLMPYKDGGSRFIAVNYVPDFGESGAVRGFFALVEDISQKKQAEAAVQASEEKYRSLFDSIDQGFCLIEMLYDERGKLDDWRFLEVNEAFEKNNGLTEAAGKTIRELAPDIEPKWFEIYGKVAATGESIRFEEHSTALNRHFDLFASRVGDAGSRKVAVVFTDISERKLAEEKIKQLAERNREILESISDGFFALDRDWRFTYVNSQTEFILDKKSGDLIGNVLWDVYNLAGSEFEKAYHRTANEGVVSTFTAYFPDHDRWYEVNAYPASNGITVFFRNATERKRREANLAFLADITEDFSRQSSADQIMHTVGEKIGVFLNISNCLFAEIDETADKVSIESAWQTDGQPSLVGVYQLSEFVSEEFQQAARGGETIVIRDTQNDSRTDAAAYAAYNIGAFVTVPFKRAGVWKFLLTVNDSAVRDWREDEIELVREVTSRLFPRLERARAEEALLKSETEFRQLANAVPQIVWVADAGGKIEYINEQWTEFSGLTLEETDTPEILAEIIHPDDRKAVFDEWAQAFASGKPYQLEARMRHHKTGEYCWFLMRSEPSRDAGGAILKWFGTSTDITSHKEAELRLRESEEQLRALADSIPQLAWMAEPDGFIFWYNRRWYDYTGTTAEEMTGWGWQSVHDAEMLPNVLEQWQASIQTGEPFEMEFPLRRGADGAFRWFLTRVVPLRDTGGRIARWFGTNTDIDELRQARVQAEAANRLKDEFLATVSHELRTPLNAILGWSEMLKSGKATGEIAERANETIYRNAKSQAQLIEDLLDVSRIITGKMKFETRPVNFAAVIHEAIDTLRPAAGAKAIELTETLDSEPCIVGGDAQRLQQIVWNLISNAVKFTTDGGNVEIALENNNSRARLTVTDSGKGIEAEFLPFIFERFRQEDASSTRRHGGLGLGLAIVRQLVELHGGTISAASAGENLGSTFSLELPLVLTSERQTTQKGEKAKIPHETIGDGFSKNQITKKLTGVSVLLVDDELDTLEMLDAALTVEGAQVRVAISARDAFEILQDWQPDALVSDIAMPDEDGYSLIKKVRELAPEKGGLIPAIAMTAYVRVEDRMRVLASGFQMYVPKPAESAELINAITNLVGEALHKN